MKVLQFPLAKITPWFIAGIAFAYYTTADVLPVFICLSIAAVCAVVAWLFAKRDLIQKVYFGLGCCALSFLLGTSAMLLHSGTFSARSLVHHLTDSDKIHQIKMVLRERLKQSPTRQRYFADVMSVDNIATKGRILVHFDRSEFPEPLAVGTILKIDAPVVRHGKPKNPEQFDYGAYLEQKSVMAQVFARASGVKISQQPKTDIFYYADRIRHRIISNFEKSGVASSELAVIAALLLGQQQEIDREILRDYQLAGAVHILSVSGLHVGMILMFMQVVLQLFPNTGNYRRFKLVLIVVSLWGFAVLAGLSPSVVRSVTMFSFVAIGMHLRRKTNVFHTLLVSMLLILLFEPAFLFDVGFQLSYLALFFILWVQPMLTDLWNPENAIVRYFWQIVTVSFAAQLGTMPLSIYYFHQFPGLFFLTNLIVIPLLSIAMALGVLAIIPALNTSIPVLLVSALSWSVSLLNDIIGWIASFEQFVWTNIPMNRWIMLAGYFLIICAIRCLYEPAVSRVFAAMASALVFQCTLIAAQYQTQTAQHLVVFNAFKSTGIVNHNGRQITAYGNRKFIEGNMLQNYATAHFAKIRRGNPIKNLFFFKGRKIAIIDTTQVYPHDIRPDVLLIRQSPRLNLDRALQTIKPKLVVADASNYKTYVKLWKASCKKYKIPFHATAETGFFKL